MVSLTFYLKYSKGVKKMSESKCLERFFAVTKNSLYKVVVFGEEDVPYAEKVAGEGTIKIGDKIKGSMLAVAKWLQFYVPEKYGMASPLVGTERRLEYVNTRFWQGKTSLIVALFMSEEEAMFCFGQKQLEACDKRWIEQTKEVIGKVHENHPNLTVCKWHELSLIPVS